MVRSVHSRIRLLVGVLGCAILATSFIGWAQSLRAAADRYTWVPADPSRRIAAETAELWQVSASCIRPYFAKAVLRSKAKLAAHYKAAPDEIRARLDAGAYPGQSVRPAAWHPRQSGGQDQTTGRSNPYGEYAAALQVKYAEWYAALFKLEIEASNWQRRLLDIADQTVVLSAASRASFAAYARGATKLTGSPEDFDGYLLTALGLGGFSSDEQMALKSACVTVNPVVESSHDPHILGALWHWPVDCLAEFSFGLELVLISMFFAPIALWIGTGDLAPAPPIQALTDRLSTAIRNFNKSRLLRGVLERVRQIHAAGCAARDGIKSYAASRRTRRSIARIVGRERGDRRLRPLRTDQGHARSSRRR